MSTPVTLPDLDIIRTTLTACTLRAAEPAADAPAREGLGLLDVRFSPFNTWYEVCSYWEGEFLERTVPGAFKRTIGQHNDPHSSMRVKTLFNHGQDMYVDQKLLGDVDELVEEADSPRSTVWLWDTSYNRDLLPGLRSGAYGSSFMFRVMKDEWDYEPGVSDYNPEGLPERTLKEVSVLEAGPVTWPANPAATAGMRCISATDAYYEHLARRDPVRVEAMRSKLTALRGSRLVPDARPADGLAPARPTDSAPGRSGGLTPAQRRERIYPTLKGASSESGAAPAPARGDRD